LAENPVIPVKTGVFEDSEKKGNPTEPSDAMPRIIRYRDEELV
jgi:hypothetical protein